MTGCCDVTVSEMAWKEFEELKAENERLLMLQSEAENYACRVRCQSTVILCRFAYVLIRLFISLVFGNFIAIKK